MQVNVSSLKNELDKLNSNLDNYNDIYLNLYNELKNSHVNANSYKTTLFYDSVNNEKLLTQIFYDELVSLKKIYDYIYNNYKEIGKVIKFDLDKQSEIFNKLSQIKIKLDNLNRKNSSVQVSTCPKISNLISGNMNNIYSIKKNIITLEKEYKIIFKKIEYTERTIENTVNRFNISFAKETDIKEFI